MARDLQTGRIGVYHRRTFPWGIPMRRLTVLTAASMAALLLAAGPTLAQEALRVGQTVEASIGDGDAQSGDDYRYDDYRITARAGQRLEIVMRAEAFDAYLSIYADGETDGEPLAEDDDGLGEGTNSRLRFTAADAGTYVLRARTLSGLDGGAYALSLAERSPAPRAPRPQTIRLGGEAQGQLSGDDPEQDQGSAYDAYVFRARAGDRLAISLASEAFDPVVRVGRAQRGGGFDELAMNDDAPGGGLDSRLIFTAPDSGEYVVRVTGLAEESTGAYTLKLEEGPAAAPTAAIAVGDTVRGELTAEDGVNDQGARADAYRFQGRAGQRIAALLSSEAFDTYLQLFRETEGGRVSIAEDDDGAGEGTNSRLAATLDDAGTYVIEARAFGDGSGAYTLTLTETAPPPPATPLGFGETVQGEITADDPKTDDGKGYDAYGFSGAAKQRVQIIVRSGDFDSYVEIGRPGETWEALASDDDGLGEGLDSRLNFTLPEDGDYVIRAMPLASDGKGLYSIQLIDRGPEPLPGSILVGATARGALNEADAVNEEGAYFDAYELQAKGGEKLRLTMVSNAVDALVEVGRVQDDGGFESLASDDDGLSDTHAQLDWTAPEDGVYVVRARSYAPGAVGDYALTIEKQP
jgi:hypothetical protein